jgi:hypothetical protein
MLIVPRVSDRSGSLVLGAPTGWIKGLLSRFFFDLILRVTYEQSEQTSSSVYIGRRDGVTYENATMEPISTVNGLAGELPKHRPWNATTSPDY